MVTGADQATPTTPVHAQLQHEPLTTGNPSHFSIYVRYSNTQPQLTRLYQSSPLVGSAPLSSVVVTFHSTGQQPSSQELTQLEPQHRKLKTGRLPEYPRSRHFLFGQFLSLFRYTFDFRYTLCKFDISTNF